MEEADANMEEANRGNLSLLPAWLYGYAQYILFFGVMLVILAVSKTFRIVLPYVPGPIRNVGNRLCLTLWPFLTKIPAVRVLVTCLKYRRHTAIHGQSDTTTLYLHLPAIIPVCILLYMTMEDGTIAVIVLAVVFVLAILAIAAYLLYKGYCKRSEAENRGLLEEGTQGRTKGPEVIDGLCVIAADQHTLSTIAEQVREATGGFYTVEEHLVTNRKAVAELPIYNRAICCVRNAERNISFNNQGAPEPDADLGFRAFDRMEAYTGDKSGVLLLMFDHAESQDISKLHSMAGITPSPRLSDTAQVGRFLTVYRQLSRNQKEFISKWATL
ncbi:hypothetical protein Bbelb_217570 [Branchiostoma belcheri]|nr:hypothetical protein Bbelb_217570 [Branchiostoma belcheri]